MKFYITDERVDTGTMGRCQMHIENAKTVTTLLNSGRDEDESPVLYVIGKQLGTSLLVPSITNISRERLPLAGVVVTGYFWAIMSLLRPELWER